MHEAPMYDVNEKQMVKMGEETGALGLEVVISGSRDESHRDTALKYVAM